MACTRPIPARQDSPGATPQLWPAIGTENMELPCGKCLDCKTERASEWADRCSHEASLWPHNTFCTLTYDDARIPRGGHLVPKDLQAFLKRLRRAAERPNAITTIRTANIRFFACGEYGDERQRPHYHAILFNCGFADRKLIGGSETHPRYTSDTLSKLWGHGLVDFGNFDPAGAMYIAKYAVKKWALRWDDDDGFADENGEWYPRPPPFGRMSLRPSIGKNWLEQHRDDLRDGFLVSRNGRKKKIPRTYLRQLQKIDPELLEHIEHKKEKNRTRVGPREENTKERREAREKITKGRHDAAEAKRKL